VHKVIFVKSPSRYYLYPDRIFNNFIKPLIWEGLVCKQIMRCCNITETTIKRFIYTYGNEQDIQKIESNFKYIRKTVPKLIQRRCNSYYPLIKTYILQGRTAIETCKLLRQEHKLKIGLTTLRNVVKRNGDKNIIDLLYKNGKDRVKEVSMRNCTAKTSKIEMVFKNIVQQYFPEAIGNYPVQSLRGFNWLIDVALPERKIAFEYDGTCWHNEERDRKRDADLAKQGWRVIRFPYGPTPKREVLEQDFINKARELYLI